MPKKKNKIEFKGLVAYNHIQKFVKLSLNEQEISLRKSSYFQKANKNSFRDIVKRSFDKSKGKSKKQVEKIVMEIVNESLQEGGYIGDFDFQNIAYWELEDFLLDIKGIEGQQIQLTQNNIIPDLEEDLEDVEGTIEDIGEELLNTRRILNKYRDNNKLDSNNVPSFSGFKDVDGVFKIKLIDSAGSVLVEEQDALIEKLTEKGIETKTPILEKPEKQKISKEQILADEEVIQAKEKTKQAKEKTRQEEIETLKLKKLSLMDDFRFAKEMDDQEDMKTIKAKIKAIQKQID